MPLLVIPADWSIHDSAEFVTTSNSVEVREGATRLEQREGSTIDNSPKKEETLTHTEIVFNETERDQQQGVDYFASLKNQSFTTYARYLYLAGVLIFSLNFLIQFLLIIFQRATNPIVKDGRYKIVEINQDKAPFSFGQHIFILSLIHI